MADLIRSDIEKIERALNICVDDVGFEVTLNAGKNPWNLADENETWMNVRGRETQMTSFHHLCM